MNSSNLTDVGNNKQREDKSEMHLFELASILLKHAKVIVYTVGTVIVLTTIILLLMPNKYTSTASILPTESSDPLSDLKSLSGLGSSIIDQENPTELFPSILESRHVANALLSKKYSFHVNSNLMTLTLPEYFGEYDSDELFSKLANISSFSVDKKPKIIRLAVETKYPAFSKALAAKYILELENYNLHKRRSKAKENEVYLAKQLSVIKTELSAAEDELERFRAENSNWHVSSNSMIRKTLSRLEREVEIKSSIYLFLTQEYERAKFEAQKDVPIVQVLDSPSLPTKKTSPHRALILLLIAIMSFFLVVFIIIVYEALKKHSKEQGSFDEIKNDLRNTYPTISRLVLRKINQ